MVRGQTERRDSGGTVINLRRVLTMHDPEPVELVLASVAVANAAGLWLLRPFGRLAVWGIMARAADETTWAVVLGSLGAVHLAAVVAETRGRRRVAAAAGNMLGLVFVTVAFVAAGPARWTTGTPVFAVLSVAAIWTTVRVGASRVGARQKGTTL